MAKKIFVVTGSPRKDGNSAQMADAFLRGAQEAGHQTVRFDAAFHPAAGCVACDQCWTKGRACAVDDDWQEFSRNLEAADVVVFAYPMYWNTMPSQLKRYIDRLYSYCSPKAQPDLLYGKQSVLLLCGECEGEKIFRDALSAHAGLNGFFHWEDAGKVLADLVFERGAIQKTDALERAYALGKSL